MPETAFAGIEGRIEGRIEGGIEGRGRSDYHSASCEFSNPIREGWEDQTTTWDNHTKVSLMALHDSGEVCHTVLFDAVANLSNSYLTWIPWVK